MKFKHQTYTYEEEYLRNSFEIYYKLGVMWTIGNIFSKSMYESIYVKRKYKVVL